MIEKQAREVRIFAFLLFLALAVFSAYHLTKMQSIYFNLATGLEPPPEIFLLERKEEVSGGNFTIYASQPLVCTLCGGNVTRQNGENHLSYEGCGSIVNITCGTQFLRFSFARIANEPAEWINVTSRSVHYENGTLFVELNITGRTNGWQRMRLLLDGREVTSPLVRLDGNYLLKEKISPVPPGNKRVEVWMLNSQLVQADISIPASYDFSLSIVVALALAFLFVSRRKSIERVLAFFVLLAVALTVHFHLSYYGVGWIVALAGICVLVWEWLRKKESSNKKEADVLKEGAMFAAVLAVYILFLTTLVGKEDVWGAYYYRQVQETLQRGTTAYVDELSYLGRNFTYPPGFMEFAAQIAKLVGAYDIASIQIPFNIAIVAFFSFTLYLVFSKCGRWERLLASALFISEWATLYTATGITLHLYAYAFLNIAIIMLERNTVLAALALGLSLVAHPTTVVLFPFFSLMSRAYVIEWKWITRIISVLVGATILAMPFFIPILLANGMPNEIVPERWGYLLSFGLEGLQFDFQFVLVLALLTAIYGMTRGTVVPALAILLLFVVNAFVSARANLLFAFAIATGIPLILKKMITPSLLALVFVIVAMNYLTAPVISSGTSWWCTWGQANNYCLQPMRYLAHYTESGSVVALNPYFGHLETYHGKRQVLADLYVEWADYDKWESENDYYEQKNISYLSEYPITVFVLDDLHEKRDLSQLDRVYDNGFMHVFIGE